MPYLLPDIPYLKLWFVFSALEDCTLPIFKGSMLRGAFGHALKKTVCVMGPEQPCLTCMLRPQCAYTRVFETFIEGEPPPLLDGLKTSPRPFVIDDFEPKRDFQKGDHLEFDFSLFGRACEMHPYVIFAFMRAGDRGFARQRHKFLLEKVLWQNDEWQQLYDGGRQALVGIAKPKIVVTNGPLSSPLTLKFLTPTRIKYNNRLTMDFSFRVLAFKMLSRVLEIAHFHVPGAEVNWEFRELLDAADEVRIASKRLYWEDVKRYSNRQNSKLTVGGFFGDLVLEGDLEPFNQLLRTVEVLHVGKGTVFGLGKVRVGEF